LEEEEVEPIDSATQENNLPQPPLEMSKFLRLVPEEHPVFARTPHRFLQLVPETRRKALVSTPNVPQSIDNQDQEGVGRQNLENEENHEIPYGLVDWQLERWWPTEVGDLNFYDGIPCFHVHHTDV
jgi:hypothetical protein